MKKNEILLGLAIWDFEDVSHQYFTDILDLQPSKIFVKGALKNSFTNVPYKQNAWFFDSPKGVYASFDEQITSLLDIIEPKKDILIEIAKKYQVEMNCGIYIYVNSEESTPYVHFDQRYHTIISQLNIEFDLDIILLDDSNI